MCLYRRDGSRQRFSILPFEEYLEESVANALLASEADLAYTLSLEHLAYGLVRCPADGSALFIGPCPTYVINKDSAEELLAYFNLPFEWADQLMHRINDVPQYDLGRFMGLLTYIGQCILGAPDVPVQHVIFPKPAKGSPVPVMNTQKPQLYEESYVYEHFGSDVMACIEKGQPDTLATILNSLGSGTEGVPEEHITPERVKYSFLVSLGMALQAARKAGVSENSLMSTLLHYLRALSQATQMRDIVRLMKYMFMNIALRTARSRMLRCEDMLARKIVLHIEENLSTKQSPTDIAQALSMNTSYLCTHFRKATGKTISGYINERKVAEAKFMLTTTTLPIAAISEKLGYTTQNYFNTIFRRLTGLSPGQYRTKYGEAW